MFSAGAASLTKSTWACSNSSAALCRDPFEAAAISASSASAKLWSAGKPMSSGMLTKLGAHFPADDTRPPGRPTIVALSLTFRLPTVANRRWAASKGLILAACRPRPEWVMRPASRRFLRCSATVGAGITSAPATVSTSSVELAIPSPKLP